MAAGERPIVIEKTAEELRAVVGRVRAQRLEAGDADTLEAVVASYGLLVDLLRDRQTTIARLRQLLFGPASERRKDLFGEATEQPEAVTAPAQAPETVPRLVSDPRPEGPARGHGRHGADDFPAAVRVETAHGTLHEGDG